jgi:two-component system phosphate regulon response regulator PhoB
MTQATRRLLLVDDDTANLEVLSDVLRAEGYAVVCARNGAEAMACLLNAQPDVVMLDYVMPTMDGATMATKLKGDDTTRTIAILMTSGLPEEMVRPRCQLYDAFLQKPYDVDDVLRTLDRLCLARTVTV